MVSWYHFLGGQRGAQSTSPEPMLATKKFVGAGLRFDVLKRDGFTCQLCGATREFGIKLEVDHKVPLAAGGKSTAENLWTLCSRCNNGKSNKLLPEDESFWAKLHDDNYISDLELLEELQIRFYMREVLLVGKIEREEMIRQVLAESDHSTSR